MPKKEGLVSFADLRGGGGFGKKERGGVFEERRGVDILMHTMETTISSRQTLINEKVLLHYLINQAPSYSLKT